MTSTKCLHTSIQIHILMTHITFTSTYHFSVIYFFTTFFISYLISYTFHVILYFTSCSCNCTLSSHNSAMFLISCHIFFTFHLHILVIFFYVSCLQIPWKRIREITVVPEDTITVRDNDLYLYIPEGIITVRDSDLCHVICDPKGVVYTRRYHHCTRQ